MSQDLHDLPRLTLIARIKALEAAIRRHMNQRGDDRCHLDDGELYAALPEGDTRPARETAVTLENCHRFIDSRQAGREYVSPQRRIDELEAALRSIIDAADECDAPHWSLRVAIDEGREALEKAT